MPSWGPIKKEGKVRLGSRIWASACGPIKQSEIGGPYMEETRHKPCRPIDRWVPTNSVGDGANGLVTSRVATSGGGEGGYDSGGADGDGCLSSSHGFSNSLTIGIHLLGIEWTKGTNG